jgi:hypothetical protein
VYYTDVDIFSTLTTTLNSQATATSGIASLLITQSTSVVIVSTTAVGHSSIIIASNTPSTSASTTSGPSASPTPSSQAIEGLGGLSVGDKAGIAVAVLTAVILIFTVLICCQNK